MKYKAFTRTWWRENKSWPNGLEPHAGDKTYFKKVFYSESAAREFCQDWNSQNIPGRLSNKAEFESV